MFLFFTLQQSVAQVSIVFDSFPQNGQLYQRNDFNKTKVDIIGNIYTDNYSEISLTVLKNNSKFYYKKNPLTYTTNSNQIKGAAFSFAPIINAELSEYTFQVYVITNKDSVLVKEAQEVLCGENVIVYGQSNALANDESEIIKYTAEQKFGRTAFADFQKNEFLWLPVFKWNFWSVGLLGLEIQRQLIDNYKIPVGIINGAEGNKSIVVLSERDAIYHDNSNTIYGRLLKKSKGLGIAQNVRIIVWRQGEAEALDPNYKNDYDKNFLQLRKQLYEDYPSIKKIYTFQNNIYFGNQPLAGDLRDYQRKINSIFPDCEVISTVATPTFDGLHYLLEGYLQNGLDASRLVAKDFFNSSDTLEIKSPNIQNIYFTPNKDSLILEFEKNQKMIYPKEENFANTTSKNIKDYIYLDGVAGNIETGIGVDNYIILKLKTPSNAKKLSYNPDSYSINMSNILPGIFQLKNSRGLNALTFKNVEITKKQIETTNNNTTLIGEWDLIQKKRINLNWDKIALTNYTYTIEKAQVTPTFFYTIGQTPENNFYDYKVKKGIKYFYRIKIQDGTSILYSNVIEIQFNNFTEFNASIEDLSELLVYPNPIQNGNTLNITTNFEEPIKSLKVYDSGGKIINDIDITTNQYRIETKKLNVGFYLIEAILEDNTKFIKKFVVQ